MNAERIRELLYKNCVPETLGEELCLLSYDMSKSGHTLKDVVFSVEKEFNQAGVYELEMIIAGYMMGQAQYVALNETNNNIQ